MKKPVVVSFNKIYSDSYYWAIGPLVLTDAGSLRYAVNAFKRFCNAVDARAPFEIVGNAKEEAHKLLTK